MALQKQTVPINFGQGIDTKTDDKQVLPGRLVLLENGVFKKLNKISKRNGYDILGTEVAGDTTDISAGKGLGTFNDELTLFDGNEMYTYSESNDKWIKKSRITSIINTSKSIIRNQAAQTNPSVNTNLNVTVCAWEDTRNGIRCSVLDEQTGSYLIADTEISSTGMFPKVVPLGRSLLVFFIDGTSIKYRKVNTSEPTTFAAEVEVATDLDATNKYYDVKLINERVFVAWNDNDASGEISVKYIKKDFTTSSVKTYNGEQASSCISIFSDSLNNVWICYYDGTDVKCLIRDYSLGTAVLTPTSVETVSDITNITGIITDSTNNNATIFYEQSATDNYNYLIRKNTITKTGTIGTASVFKRSVGLASKAFEFNSEFYLTLAHESTLQATYFLTNSNGDIVSKISPLLADGLITGGQIQEIAQVKDGRYIFVSAFKDKLFTDGGSVFTRTGIKTTSLDFTAKSKFVNKQLGNNLHIVGGVMQSYDGAKVTEHGFHLFPENISISSATTGGSIDDGVHEYSIVYEWTDNFGQIHRSAPSIAQSVTNSGGDTSKNTLTIPTLRLTRKADVNIVVYRTEAAGTIFYRVNSITDPLANDTTVDTVSFSDTTSDSNLISNEILYTVGGVLDNISPPSCNDITSYKNRLFISGLEDENALWFSKVRGQNSPVEFSDSFVINVDPTGGGIGAHAVLDDKFIIFKKNNAIFAFVGNGPTNTGDSNDFSDPQQIPSDVGTDNPRSVINTPAGLMFQSHKGIYLLDRSLQTTYIGALIEDFNDLTVTGAALVPTANQVRFVTEDGHCLVYDYLFKQWSTFTNHEAADGLVWKTTFVFLKSTGEVYKENSNKFVDGTIPIKLKLVTGWLNLADIQSFKRIYKVLLLGTYKSKHKLIFKIGYDFNDYFTEEKIVDTSTIYSGAAYGEETPYGSDSPYGGKFKLYQFRFFPKKQKCESIRFSIEDVQSEDFGEGYDISAITLEAGLKAGLEKTPKTRTFGTAN